MHDRPGLELRRLLELEAEALDRRRERRIAIEAVLDVERVDVRAHVRDRAVAPPEEEEERRCPALGQGLTRVDRTDRVQPAQDLPPSHRQPLVADVVAQLRCENREIVHRDERLAAVVELDVVLERVVLEDHRDAFLAGAEQRLARVRALDEEPAHPDGQIRLAGDPDLDVGGPVARAHLDEAPLEVVAHRLGHAFAADEAVHARPRPVEAPRVERVDDVLEEGRIRRDEVVEVPAERLDRVDDLREVRAGRLHHARLRERDAHVRAGRPGAHRERVDREEALGRERVPHPVGRVQVHVAELLRRAQPVVRLAGRPGGLVDQRAGDGDPPVAAALGEPVALHVALLARLGERAQLEDPEDVPAVGEELRVRRDALLGPGAHEVGVQVREPVERGVVVPGRPAPEPVVGADEPIETAEGRVEQRQVGDAHPEQGWPRPDRPVPARLRRRVPGRGLRLRLHLVRHRHAAAGSRGRLP